MLELAVNCAVGAERALINEEFVRSLTPSVAAGRFDADGDVHYDLLSALQKSIRGSDPDAALFYLAKLWRGEILFPLVGVLWLSHLKISVRPILWRLSL